MRRNRHIREQRERLLRRRLANKKPSQPLRQAPQLRISPANKAQKLHRPSQPLVIRDAEEFALSDKPLFSILMACKNAIKYLDAAIQSVQSQTYSNWELIAIDDVSQDNTWNLLQEYAKTDPRIRVYQNTEPLFCSSTYGKALSLASGEICGVLDSDDALAVDAIEAVVERYRLNPKVGHIYTQFWFCDALLRALKKGFCHIPRNRSILASEKTGRYCYSHWRTFRTCLRDRGNIFIPGLRSSVDRAMGYVLEEMAVGGFCNLACYFYRDNASGISRAGRANRLKEIQATAQSRRKKKTFRIIHV